MSWCFPVWYFYPFSLFVMFLWLPYFSSKSFGFSCIRLLVCFRVISSQLLIKIFFRCVEMFCFVCIVLPYVDISSNFLLSPVLSGLFPVWPFSFRSNIFQRLSFVLSFWSFFLKIYNLHFYLIFPSWFWLFLIAFWGDINFLTN